MRKFAFVLALCGCASSAPDVHIVHYNSGAISYMQYDKQRRPHGVAETWTGYVSQRSTWEHGFLIRDEYDRDGDGVFEEVWIEGDDLLLHRQFTDAE
jgi:hypothetical protein